MARMTKAARRRAALKGWRNRTQKNPSKRKKSASKRVSAALKKYMASLKKSNPSRKGGKVRRLRNFTGTITERRGEILVKGKGR